MLTYTPYFLSAFGFSSGNYTPLFYQKQWLALSVFAMMLPKKVVDYATFLCQEDKKWRLLAE